METLEEIGVRDSPMQDTPSLGALVSVCGVARKLIEGLAWTLQVPGDASEVFEAAILYSLGLSWQQWVRFVGLLERQSPSKASRWSSR